MGSGGSVNLIKMVLLGVLVISVNLFAWQKNGVPINATPNTQIQPTVVVPEGKDFFYVMWSEVIGIHRRVLAGKYDIKTGIPMWSSPFIVADTGRNQWGQQAIATISGDCILTFQANFADSGGVYTVYATKISPEKSWVWPSKWIRVGFPTSEGDNPELCLDSSGEGCYITWEDQQSYTPYVWAAHVTKDGQAAWTTPMSTNPSGNPAMVRSGKGCIIFWQDGRTSAPGPGTFGQRIVEDSAAGEWGPNGKLIIPMNGKFILPQSDLNLLSRLDEIGYGLQDPYVFPYAIQDNHEGAVVNSDSVWQRVDSIGDTRWSHLPNVKPPPYCIISDEASGAIGCCDYMRMGSGDHSILYLTQIDSVGKAFWGQQPLRVWEGPEDTTDFWEFPTLTTDSHHGVVITWVENDPTGNKLLVTRVDTVGQELWQPPSVICDLYSAKDHPFIVNANQGYIVVWEDARSGKWNLYASYIDSTGQVGIDEAAGRAPPPNEGLLSIEPNPFSRAVGIRCEYPEASREEGIKIYDVAGKLVKFFSRAARSSPLATVVWDGRNDAGAPVPAGIYFIKAGREMKKVVRIE